MARRLFIVEDTFVLRNRGIVLAPGIVPEADERLRVGDRIVLRRPDDSSLDARIGGLEHLDPNPRREIVILLKDPRKEDVPIGTEVWSGVEGHETG